MDRDEIAGHLHRLFATDDANTIEQGCELAETLHDPELYDQLLACVRLPTNIKTGLQQIVVSDYPRGSHSVIVLRLLHSAPPESAVASALRRQIRRLHVSGNSLPLDLGCLASLTSLRGLKLSGPVFGRWPAPLAPERLEIGPHWECVPPFQDLATLRHLSLAGGVPLTDLIALSPLTELASLSLCGVRALRSLEGLGAISSLAWLEIDRCDLEHWGSLCAAHALRSLVISPARPDVLGDFDPWALFKLPNLGSIRIPRRCIPRSARFAEECRARQIHWIDA